MGAAGIAATGATAATSPAQGGIGEDCLIDWPEATDVRIDISDDVPEVADAVPASGDIVVFVPGWLNDDVIDAIDINGATLAAALEEGLADEGYQGHVAVAMWDSTTLWSLAKWRADAAGSTLSTWIEDSADQYDSITLIGHSLGARVALQALSELSEASVESVALLGGAVDPDTVCDEYYDGIEQSVVYDVYNYHTGDDGTVCSLYAIREFTEAIGCSGKACGGGWFSSGGSAPANYEEVDLTGEVDGHCGYLKPNSMDFSGRNCLDDIVDNQLSEYTEIDDCWWFCW